MHVQLRPWQIGDIQPLSILANNPHIAAMLRDAFPQPYKIEHATAWVERQLQQPGQSFAIVVDGAFAGGIGMEPRYDVYRHSVEIGYWLGQLYWGRGIAAKAIGLLVAHIWQQVPAVQRIEALVFAPNIASQKALQKNDFVHEGTRRNAVIKNGVLLDDHIWALLRT